MKDSGLISVVVPIYNADAYLKDALESLRSQSYANFEAILVNDGSTDMSEEICRGFCHADSRFRLITQENKGLSGARNTGIDNAEGEWINFLDADDMLLPGSLETLMKQAKRHNVLIVNGTFTRVKPVHPVSVQDKSAKMNSEQAIKLALYQKRTLSSACGVLFHISVFNGVDPIRFRHCMYEDLDFFYRAYDRVPEICLVDDIIYYYRDNPGSFINTWSAARLDVLDVTDRIVNYMKDRSPELYMAALDRRFSAHFNMLLEMERYKIDNPSQKQRCLKVIKEQRCKELFDPDVRLKNKLGALISYMGMPAIRTLCRL